MQTKTKIVSCHTDDSKPVKQEVNCTVRLPPLVFPAHNITYTHTHKPINIYIIDGPTFNTVMLTFILMSVNMLCSSLLNAAIVIVITLSVTLGF
jgi:hypothetical protein